MAKPKSLRAVQSQFARATAHLILHAYSLGYEVTLGDAYRDPRAPYGSKSSKHRRRLAIDLNLFWDGRYLARTSEHRELGEWWEQHGGIWGGRWQDGNHYEWPEQGIDPSQRPFLELPLDTHNALDLSEVDGLS